jgi:cytochrome c oxidase assembly factor CtaG
VRSEGLARAFDFTYDQLVPRLWGVSVLDDQAAAGAIMWVPGSVIFLVPVAVLSIRLLDASRAHSATSNKVKYEAVKVE